MTLTAIPTIPFPARDGWRFHRMWQTLWCATVAATGRAFDVDPPDTAPDGDLLLLRRASAGDEEAFRRLVERHQRRLLTVCGRMLGDPVEAQDVVQETFFKAYRRAERFGSDGRLGAWLYRVAVNGCLHRLRRRRLVSFVGLGGETPRTIEPEDPAPGPESRLESNERWQRVRRSIESLPPGQKAVLVLARFEGASMREIASTLGITEKAVEGRLTRALAKLAKARRQRP